MSAATMKALVYQGPNNFSLMDVPMPKILAPTDVIGKVTLAAVCSSDIHMAQGDLPNTPTPRIMGHEFCIEITEVGSDVKKFKVGDRCVVKPGAHCEECLMCRMGLVALCENGGVFGSNGKLEGGHAEYVRVPWADQENQLHKIPEGMSEEDIILAPDMLATAWFGIANTQLQPGQSLAVIGVGPVGLSTCLLAKKVFGAGKVIAVDIAQYRLDLAVKEGIADYVINPATDDVAQKFLEITGGLGVDATVETTGLETTMAMAVSATRPGGIVSTVAIFSDMLVKLPLVEMIVKNQQLKMGIQVNDGVPEMIDLIKQGKLDTKFMLTHRAPLNDIINGYEVFGKQQDGCIKWLVTPFEN
ncbi:Polyketide synthase, enoylreductase [Syntrophomonas zehnderi OL-4]|uniref:Polyketide synthase, enoylreductase n=1 Tax=Syntrophomonas zehnderi OL-4 TaxID=690567 RepID=A0A0E4GFF1_9FIRM|nr:alcohol dehydrogenase catalytic domain-containing protein [Syntrophomonas zehnderi]CFY08572.1 Polyketide synthase, enoylreductase [Syntrophomonas zehnderi OL-4]